MRANNSNSENNHLKLQDTTCKLGFELLTRKAEGRTVTLRAVPSSIPGPCWKGMCDRLQVKQKLSNLTCCIHVCDEVEYSRLTLAALAS